MDWMASLGHNFRQLRMIHGFSPEYLRPLFEEIIQRCQSKKWQAELKTSLKHIAVAQLGKDERAPRA